MEISLILKYINFRLCYVNSITMIFYVVCVWPAADISFANGLSVKMIRQHRNMSGENNQQDTQCTRNVTYRRVRVTTVAVEKQYYIS